MEDADGESVWEPSSNSSCADFSGVMHNQHVEQPATDDDARHQFSCTDGDVQSILDDAKRDQTPLFIELCAGCGILSATVAALGFDVMAVDHTRNRHKTRVKMFNLDLSKEHSWVVLRHIARECRIIAVHIAPPCGTCSRAREIKLSSSWHGPQPLRNEVYPYGVPWMSAKDAERVDSANNLYKHMAEFCKFLEEISIAWTIENPTNRTGTEIFLCKFSFMCIWWTKVQSHQFSDQPRRFPHSVQAMRQQPHPPRVRLR